MKKEEFVRLYNTLSLAELAELLGVSKPTIYKNLKKLDVKLKGRTGRRKKKLVIEE